jgi:DNA-binding LytR/AlgR family response regulator
MEDNNKQLDQSNDFYINIDRRLIKIDLPSIYLIEAKGDYIHIKTEDKNYVVHSTLKKIEEKLPDSLFLKIHRSYIINIKKIIDIPVSRSKRPELMKRLDLL